MTVKQATQIKLWQQSIKLLHSLESLAATEQQEQLKQLATQQPALHQMVQKLMRHNANQSPLDRIPQQLLGINVNLGAQRVGDYQLLEEISASVMGTVYRAQRADERYQQQVAIKFLATSGDPNKHQLFIQERRLLAELEHPNITRILDAGEFNGAPYVVMEWVNRINILDYCRQQQLSLNIRLQLFATICQAIQYAHQHLIVHGDIKPQNILVNNDGEPKLLDFGIAHRLNDESVIEHHNKLFTTGYASPEQLQEQVISTASDIFSLGMLLFEMVYLQHPFPITDSLEQWKHQLLNDTPISINTAQLDALAIRRDWRLDLHSICHCALQKQPGQRYNSAQALADDIHSLISHRPVKSRQGNWLYGLLKFSNRHRFASIATGIAIIITAVALVVLSWQGVLLRDALNNSEQQRNAAEQATRYIQDMMLQADPHTDNEAEVSLEQVMVDGADQLANRFTDQPEVKANLAFTLGQVLHNLGQYEHAIKTLQMVLDVTNSPHRAQAISAQANALRKLEKLPAAWEKAQQAEQLLSADQNLDWAYNRFIQVNILTEQSQFQQASELMEETLAVAQQLPIDLNIDKLMVLGSLYWNQDQLEDALASYKRGYQLAYKHYGIDHHQTGRFQYAQAVAAHRLGRFSDSQVAYEAAIAIHQRVYGDDHPTTISSKDALGALLYNMGDSHTAAGIFEDNLTKIRSTDPINQAQLIKSLHNYALVLHDLGKFNLAKKNYLEVADISLEAHGESSREYHSNLSNLSLLYLDQGQAELAMPILEKTYRRFTELFDENHQTLSFSQLHFAIAHWQLGQMDAAKPWLQKSLNIRRQFDNGQHSFLADALIWQARFAITEQDLKLATQATDEALLIRRLNFDDNNWRVFEAEMLSGLISLLKQPENTDVLRQAKQAYQAVVTERGINDWRVERLRNDLTALQPKLSMAIIGSIPSAL